MPPQPSGTIKEPSARATGTDDIAAVENRGIDPVARTVLERLGSAWHLSKQDRKRLAPLIVEKVIEGWPVRGLSSYLSANPKGVVSAVAVLTARLESLPPPKQTAHLPMPKPEWCGECDPDHRHRTNDDSRLVRCPLCHPLRHEPVNERP